MSAATDGDDVDIKEIEIISMNHNALFSGPSQTVEVRQCDLMSKLAERDAALERVAVLEKALDGLMQKYDPENPGAAFEPDSGCLECTSGTTPNKYNTGLCAHHRALKTLKETTHD